MSTIPPLPRLRAARGPVRLLAIAAVIAIALGSGHATAPTAAAADGLTMEARSLMDGHTRVGAWLAIAVHLRNDGPAIDGELRLTGGAQGRTRFGVPVDLPTQSDKTYIVYGQPPAFGRELEVSLVSNEQVVAKAKAPFTVHDPTQLTIGVVAERPEAIVGQVTLPPNQNQLTPAKIPLDPEDLPERVEAWSAIDRLIWQDMDTNRLTPAQLTALQGWISSGGRLVVVGGTAGPNALSAIPDALLPYRPTATVQVAPSSLSGLLGTDPNASDVPALGGELTGGRALATSGDRVIAAERPYGNGAVTVVGFDPTTGWIADGKAAGVLWPRLLPARTTTGLVLGDDSQLVSAVSQLPSLALPPITGLVLLLGAYILLIGPINYFVLKRLDRREWAWVTMPALVAIFAVVAYGYGTFLRGSEVLVNEVAVVRGSPGSTDGTAQVYVGVFSPTRGTYQVHVPGGALLSSPITGDFLGGDGTASALDIVQGDPARVRDLAVGFGSLRTIRAEAPVQVPLVEADLRFEDGRLKGTITNKSEQTLVRPAVVLGGTVVNLHDLAAGETATVEKQMRSGVNQFGQSLSDMVVGTLMFDGSAMDADETATYIRHTIVDQLTYDPNWGSTNQLPTDGVVILAWGTGGLMPVDITGQEARTTGNTLYYLPTDVAVDGRTTFSGDLIRSTMVDADAPFFSKDPFSINFGRGSADMSYRPIAFEGAFDADELSLGIGFGPDQLGGATKTPITPLETIPARCVDPPVPGCAPVVLDGLPEVELFDRAEGGWVRLPHLATGKRYTVDGPSRFVDPASGTVQVRFVNDQSDGIGFSFDLAMAGTIR